MFTFPAPVDRLDRRITTWMARRAIALTRLALGVVFIWFGGLKFSPRWSPASELAALTFERVTLGLVPGTLALYVVAALEVTIGVGLVLGRFLRLTIFLLLLQMVGAMSPLVLFPEKTWRIPPLVPTLEGQYIIKNLVLIGAALVIGATVRGGSMQPEPTGSAEDNVKEAP